MAAGTATAMTTTIPLLVTGIEAEDQEKGQQDLALVGAGHGRGVVMIMVVIVTMVMCVGLGHGASGNWVFDCGSKYNT